MIKMTPSIRIALNDIELERVAIVYPGTQRYAPDKRVEAVPFTALVKPESLFRKNKS